MHKVIPLVTILLIGACESVTNDGGIPLSLSFSDGSEGACTLQNIRIYTTVDIPSTSMIYNSDDNLQYDCKLEKGRTAFGEIPNTMGDTTLTHSMISSITDQHSGYSASFVIPIER